MPQEWLDAHGRVAKLARLKILDAMVSAIERRREVLEVIEQSENADVAQGALSELLHVDHECAQAILDLQTRRLTGQGRQRIVEERDRLSQDLG